MSTDRRARLDAAARELWIRETQIAVVYESVWQVEHNVFAIPTQIFIAACHRDRQWRRIRAELAEL